MPSYLRALLTSIFLCGCHAPDDGDDLGDSGDTGYPNDIEPRVSLGGYLTSNVNTTQSSHNRIYDTPYQHAFVRGGDNALYYRYRGSPESGWSDFIGIGGAIASDPMVVERRGEDASTQIIAFGRGFDNFGLGARHVESIAARAHAPVEDRRPAVQRQRLRTASPHVQRPMTGDMSLAADVLDTRRARRLVSRADRAAWAGDRARHAAGGRGRRRTVAVLVVMLSMARAGTTRL